FAGGPPHRRDPLPLSQAGAIVIPRLTPARAFDVLAASALLVVASPILAAAALLIRVTDGAPVLFRQQRLGQGRRPFRIIKLRTMAAGAVTPIGRVLR